MSRRQMLRMIRKFERRRMTSRCTISRGTWPEVTDVYTDRPCWGRPALHATTEVSSGGEQVGLHLHDVGLPWDTEVERGDVITFTKSSDPQYVGRSITVIEVVQDDDGTSRMVVCQESRQ